MHCMVRYPQNLIKEFQVEFQNSYGVFLDEENANLHLHSLTRVLFPTTDENERGQATALSCLPSIDSCRSGASITPDLGTRDK